MWSIKKKNFSTIWKCTLWVWCALYWYIICVDHNDDINGRTFVHVARISYPFSRYYFVYFYFALCCHCHQENISSFSWGKSNTEKSIFILKNSNNKTIVISPKWTVSNVPFYSFTYCFERFECFERFSQLIFFIFISFFFVFGVLRPRQPPNILSPETAFWLLGAIASRCCWDDVIIMLSQTFDWQLLHEHILPYKRVIVIPHLNVQINQSFNNTNWKTLNP